jgi:hypothetical protein
MAQPAAAFQSRTLFRAEPFSTPIVANVVVLNGASLSAKFDVYQVVSDRNHIVNASPNTHAVGPLLDVAIFSSKAGTLDVLFDAIPGTTTERSVMPAATPIVIAALTLGVVSGLRIIGQVVHVLYLNNSGFDALVEFTALVRSA